MQRTLRGDSARWPHGPGTQMGHRPEPWPLTVPSGPSSLEGSICGDSGHSPPSSSFSHVPGGHVCLGFSHTPLISSPGPTPSPGFICCPVSHRRLETSCLMPAPFPPWHSCPKPWSSPGSPRPCVLANTHLLPEDGLRPPAPRPGTPLGGLLRPQGPACGSSSLLSCTSHVAVTEPSRCLSSRRSSAREGTCPLLEGMRSSD